MKPRSKLFVLLLIAASIAALGSFFFPTDTNQVVTDANLPNSEGENDQLTQNTASKDVDNTAEDEVAPLNSLRFVRGSDNEDVAVTAWVGTPGRYPPSHGDVEKGGFFELPEPLANSTWDNAVSAHEVYARSADNKDAFWSYLPPNQDPDASPKTVELRPASPIKVEVIDPAGDALAGARIRLSLNLIGLVHQNEISAENGEAVFGATPEGDYYLTVHADGYVRHTRHLLHAYHAGSDADSVQVTLDHGATVAGRVVDEYGVAVAGAEVEIIPVSPFADEILDANFLAQVGVASQVTKSNAQGNFSVAGIETGAVQVRADAPGYGAGLSALIRVKGNDSKKINDVVLSREAQRNDLVVRVILRDPDIELSAVELLVPGGQEDAGRRCQGSRINTRDWRFPNCGKGTRELIATTTEGVSLGWSGELHGEDEVTLTAPRRLEIFVVDRLGAPVSGAWVQIWQDGRKLLDATSRGDAPIRFDTAIPFQATLIARDERRGAGQKITRIAADAADQAATKERAVITLDRQLLDLSLPPGVVTNPDEIQRLLGAQIVADDQQWIIDVVAQQSTAGKAGIRRGDRLLMMRRIGEDVEAVVARGDQRVRATLQQTADMR